MLALLPAALHTGAFAQDNPEPVIICYNGQTAIFPADWLGKPTRARATAAQKDTFGADSTIIETAMGKYTRALLAEELKHVYVTGRLSFNGQYFSGTNSREDIYIAGSGNDEIEKTFHHEFSSILLRNHSDMQLEIKWRELSPGLRNGNSASAVQAGLYRTDFDTSLCAKGYLSPYSLSNWENDFNMYAENIFAGGKRFWELTERYPLVKQKMQLVVDFYHKLWPGYTVFFFRTAAENQ